MCLIVRQKGSAINQTPGERPALVSEIHQSFDKPQAKWSIPRTFQFIAVACVLSWLLFLVGVKLL